MPTRSRTLRLLPCSRPTGRSCRRSMTRRTGPVRFPQRQRTGRSQDRAPGADAHLPPGEGLQVEGRWRRIVEASGRVGVDAIMHPQRPNTRPSGRQRWFRGGAQQALPTDAARRCGYTPWPPPAPLRLGAPGSAICVIPNLYRGAVIR
jgi:hypothetical protein